MSEGILRGHDHREFEPEEALRMLEQVEDELYEVRRNLKRVIRQRRREAIGPMVGGIPVENLRPRQP